MKKKKLLLILGILTLAILAAGTFYQYISYKLSDEFLAGYIIREVEKQIPNAKTQIENLEYHLGVNLSLNVSGVTVSKDSTKIIKLDAVQITLPIWFLLNFGGKVKVNLKGLNAIYDKNQPFWSVQKKEPSAAKNQNLDKQDEKISFKRGSVDIFIEDFFLAIYENKKNLLELNLKKVLLRNLGERTRPVYEVESNFIIPLDEGAKLGFSALLIGDVDFSQVASAKPIKSSFTLDLKNIRHPYLKNEIALIKVNGGLNYKDKLWGEVSLKSDNLISGKFSLEEKKDLNFKEINLEVVLSELLRLTGTNLNLIKGTSKTKVFGSAAFVKGEFSPKLNFILEEPISFKLGSSLRPELEGKGSWIREKVKLSFFGKILQGSFKSETEFLVNKLGEVPLKIDLSGNDFVFPEAKVKEFLYQKEVKKEVKEKSRSETVVSHKKQDGQENDFSFELRINLDNVKLGEVSSKIKGTIIKNNKGINSEDLFIQYSQGKGYFPFSVIRNEQGQRVIIFNARLASLNMSSLSLILPDRIGGLDGTLSGTSSGQLTQTESGYLYDFTSRIKAVEGEIQDLNLNDKVESLVEKLPLLKKRIQKKNFSYSDRFDFFELQGRFTNAQIDLTKILFIGKYNRVVLSGNGFIFPEDSSKEGQMNLSVRDNSGDIIGALRTYAGVEEIPVKLKGSGYNFTPVIPYTIETLGRSAAKNQLDKGKNKLKDEIKEKILKSDKAEKVLNKLKLKKDTFKKLFD